MKLVFILNSIMAGLGIIDISLVSEIWNTPIIFVSEKKPEIKKILTLLDQLQLPEEYKTVLIKNPDTWIQVEKSRLYFLALGIEYENALIELKKLQQVGQLPEPLRIANIIAKAIL